MKALHIKIHGRVQGVWFRANTQQTAQRLGLAGWVRNMPDGGVEVPVQGSRDAVNELLSWCHQGPPGARVDRVDFEEGGVDDALTGFTIRY